MGTDVAPSIDQTLAPRDSSHRRKRGGRWIALLALLILLGVLLEYSRYDLRSYALLTHFADPQASGLLLSWESYPVRTEEVVVPTASGPVRARLYTPMGVAHPRRMVVVHGMHHLGIDEPRLASFARAAAESGLSVLTPQVDALADYHVDAASIAAIGESAAWLDAQLGTGPVTVTGISFAGGLSLMAACDPRYQAHIRALALMGAYDDLSRVSRFLATSQEEFPDGRTAPFEAHDYGASVFVYAHLAQFFPAADLPVAREALRDWLWEEPDKARPLLERLSAPARATMDALLTRRIGDVRAQMLQAIQEDQPELAAISPHGQLADLRVPVFILHGSADNVIPPAESLWLGNDVPRQELRAVLITGAFSHVDPEKHPPLGEELRLVNFVAAVLRAAN
jgi:pimeloyl-ACP methyl ester carboxylesterase